MLEDIQKIRCDTKSIMDSERDISDALDTFDFERASALSEKTYMELINIQYRYGMYIPLLKELADTVLLSPEETGIVHKVLQSHTDDFNQISRTVRMYASFKELLSPEKHI